MRIGSWYVRCQTYKPRRLMKLRKELKMVKIGLAAIQESVTMKTRNLLATMVTQPFIAATVETMHLLQPPCPGSQKKGTSSSGLPKGQRAMMRLTTKLLLQN